MNQNIKKKTKLQEVPTSKRLIHPIAENCTPMPKDTCLWAFSRAIYRHFLS
jgi:hypothetical protein